MSSKAQKYDFRVGDLVVCADISGDTRQLTLGVTYKVEKILRSHIQIIGDRGYPINRFARQFKPAPVPEVITSEVITSDDQEYHEILKAQEIYEDATK
jgi:hypothetical protein